MVYDWKHLDTVKQWKNLIFLNHQHLLYLSQHLLIFDHHFVIIPETLFTAIFSKENIRKNGQKNEKCQNFEKKIFRQFKRYDDMSMSGWKHVPQKCFEHLIILTNPLLVKTPSTFDTSWKNDVFLPIFYLQQKFSHVWSTSVDQNFVIERKP